jgi:hypothetical protein
MNNENELKIDCLIKPYFHNDRHYKTFKDMAQAMQIKGGTTRFFSYKYINLVLSCDNCFYESPEEENVSVRFRSLGAVNIGGNALIYNFYSERTIAKTLDNFIVNSVFEASSELDHLAELLDENGFYGIEE